MTNFALILFFFGVYLLVMLFLDLAMILSLVWQGDERRQMMVWKASTWTLVGVTGSLAFSILESLIRSEKMSVNPFTILTAAATIYFICLLYYKKKYGD